MKHFRMTINNMGNETHEEGDFADMLEQLIAQYNKGTIEYGADRATGTLRIEHTLAKDPTASYPNIPTTTVTLTIGCTPKNAKF